MIPKKRMFELFDLHENHIQDARYMKVGLVRSPPFQAYDKIILTTFLMNSCL